MKLPREVSSVELPHSRRGSFAHLSGTYTKLYPSNKEGQEVDIGVPRFTKEERCSACVNSTYIHHFSSHVPTCLPRPQRFTLTQPHQSTVRLDHLETLFDASIFSTTHFTVTSNSTKGAYSIARLQTFYLDRAPTFVVPRLHVTSQRAQLLLHLKQHEHPCGNSKLSCSDGHRVGRKRTSLQPL
ncbi:unnamed protein product [Chondrus crispus]|uniref:Uncharacterized protein n=1 Tax=Chondrus crispus TaxID=2769 RepID=R7QA39_CHOCR|nr:unnamed protein product [Chondrus crispus]CDF34914.1 unnamed protein product [Chondrus crispus]|eukprot:XP_005714733.1 unnamed protein product [Chondrus crispus]